MTIENNNQEEITAEQTDNSNVEQVETPQITITPVDDNFIEPAYREEESFQEEIGFRTRKNYRKNEN
jgi:hypothetical protein